MCLEMMLLEIREEFVGAGEKKKGEGNKLNIGATGKTLTKLCKTVRGGRDLFVCLKREQTGVCILTSFILLLDIQLSS